MERRFHRIEKEFAARTRLAKHGLKPRHRILLYGPPGCGKSLGAERLAWNTGLPLRKVRFDTLMSSYFGETMTNLRKVFDAAQTSPCALFLDECDSLARSRTERNDVGEVTRITNALLEMLEDYKGDGLVIAATNLDSALDSALFRRFDEVMKVPLPGIEEICRLLKTTLSPMETDAAIGWREIAQAMDGMSGSEVVHIAQNAAKHSVLEGRQVSVRQTCAMRLTRFRSATKLRDVYAHDSRFPAFAIGISRGLRSKVSRRTSRNPEIDANRANPKGHANRIRDIFGRMRQSDEELRRLRAEMGLPAIPADKGFLLKLPEGVDVDQLVRALGVELVAETEEGLMLVSAVDLQFTRLEEVLRQFETGTGGLVAGSSLLDIYEKPDDQRRLQNILAPEVLICGLWPMPPLTLSILASRPQRAHAM